jgi:hypothetical protein
MIIALACLLVLWHILIFERFIAVLLLHYFKFMSPIAIDAMPLRNKLFYISHASRGPNM